MASKWGSLIVLVRCRLRYVRRIHFFVKVLNFSKYLWNQCDEFAFRSFEPYQMTSAQFLGENLRPPSVAWQFLSISFCMRRVFHQFRWRSRLNKLQIVSLLRVWTSPIALVNQSRRSSRCVEVSNTTSRFMSSSWNRTCPTRGIVERTTDLISRYTAKLFMIVYLNLNRTIWIFSHKYIKQILLIW